MNEHVKQAEDRCIEIATQTKVRIAEDALAQFSYFTDFQPTITGVELSGVGIRRSDTVGLFVMRLMVLPFFYLLCLVFLPLEAIQQFRQIRKRRSNLKQKIAMAKQEARHPQRPPEKTLHALWAHHGLHDRWHQGTEAINVLEQWVSTLYGPEVTQHVAIADRIAGVREVRAETRHRMDGRFLIKYVPALLVVIDDLTAELPPYNHCISRPQEIGK